MTAPIRILVTGASGFVGLNILEALRDMQGVRVVAAVRDRAKVPVTFRGDVRAGDLLDPGYRGDVVREIDVVLDASAWTSLWGHQDEDRRLFLEPKLALIEAARAAGVRRFVIASTTSAADSARAADSDSPGVPRRFWPHLTHLVAIEDALRRASDETFQGVTLRLGLFSGPGLPVGLAPMLVPRLRTRLVPWVDGGRTRLPILDGRDIGRAFASAAVAEDLAPYEAFNIVGLSSPTAREVISFIAETTGSPKPWFSVPFALAYPFAALMETLDPFVPWPPLVTRSIVHLLEETHADGERAERRLGFRPLHDWRDALGRELTALRNP